SELASVDPREMAFSPSFLPFLRHHLSGSTQRSRSLFGALSGVMAIGQRPRVVRPLSAQNILASETRRHLPAPTRLALVNCSVGPELAAPDILVCLACAPSTAALAGRLALVPGNASPSNWIDSSRWTSAR